MASRPARKLLSSFTHPLLERGQCRTLHSARSSTHRRRQQQQQVQTQAQHRQAQQPEQQATHAPQRQAQAQQQELDALQQERDASTDLARVCAQRSRRLLARAQGLSEYAKEQRGRGDMQGEQATLRVSKQH